MFTKKSIIKEEDYLNREHLLLVWTGEYDNWLSNNYHSRKQNFERTILGKIKKGIENLLNIRIPLPKKGPGDYEAFILDPDLIKAPEEHDFRWHVYRFTGHIWSGVDKIINKEEYTHSPYLKAHPKEFYAESWAPYILIGKEFVLSENGVFTLRGDIKTLGLDKDSGLQSRCEGFELFVKRWMDCWGSYEYRRPIELVFEQKPEKIEMAEKCMAPYIFDIRNLYKHRDINRFF